MSVISMRVAKLAVPATGVKSERTVAYTVSRADIEELNLSIEPKIRQNESERIASMEAATSIVGRRC